jgi:hypothetical protein
MLKFVKEDPSFLEGTTKLFVMRECMDEML